MTFSLLLTLLQDPVEPWFDERTAIMIGAFGGAGLGTLGGLLGAAAGALAPRGKARGLILGTMLSLLILGVVSLGVGVVALLSDQPRVIYSPFLMIGLVMTGVMGGVLPVVRKRYAEAEQRKVEAAALRRG